MKINCSRTRTDIHRRSFTIDIALSLEGTLSYVHEKHHCEMKKITRSIAHIEQVDMTSCWSYAFPIKKFFLLKMGNTVQGM